MQALPVDLQITAEIGWKFWSAVMSVVHLAFWILEKEDSQRPPTRIISVRFGFWIELRV